MRGYPSSSRSVYAGERQCDLMSRGGAGDERCEGRATHKVSADETVLVCDDCARHCPEALLLPTRPVDGKFVDAVPESAAEA